MDLSLSVSAAEHPLDQRARTHSASPCWRAQGSPQWFLPAAQQWPGFSGGSVGKESPQDLLLREIKVETKNKKVFRMLLFIWKRVGI